MEIPNPPRFIRGLVPIVLGLVLHCFSTALLNGFIINERLDRLPEKYRKWLEEEVVYIISERERDVFLDLRSTEEREAFIRAFWRRRDADPLTPVNEFRQEHYRRIEYANLLLGRESVVPGWMTDRGKMYIILGEPDDRENLRGIPALYPAELWFYQADKETGLPPLYLLFFQEGAAGPYRLYNYLLDTPQDLMPAQTFSSENPRMEAYEFLRQFSPDLAHATVTMRADQGVTADLFQAGRASLEFQSLLSNIYRSPYRRLDTSWVDMAREARGLVESDYLFNYVPSAGMANVIPGPGGASFVHYSIEIEPQHMTLVKDGDAYYTRFELRGDVTTADGETAIFQFAKEPYVRLTESQLREVRYRPFSYRDMFPLAAGDFQFRLVLKNEARTEYTLFETRLKVPERSAEPRLGDPVLLYATGKLPNPEAAQEYRTYQLGRLRLEPNARRVYAIGEPLLAYVPLDNVSDEYQLSFRVVSRDDPSVELGSKTTRMSRYGGAPVVESLGIKSPVGGHYRLVTKLLDPSDQVLETRSTDFDITPRASVLRPWVRRDSIRGEQAGAAQAVLAEQYLKMDETAKAREASERALRDNPDLIGPRVLLSRIHLEENHPLEAIELLEPAYALDKDNADVLVTLGDAHFRSGNYQRAAELLEAAIIVRRPDTYLLNALAACHAELGNTEKALAYIERSLELDPEQEATRAFRDKLKESLPRHRR